MAKDPHRFRCPCCHEQLEFDEETGIARELDARAAAPKRAESAMTELIEAQTKDAERRSDAFSRATEDTLRHADGFDALFDSALEDAKKDEDKKPRNPFDMD